MNVYRLYDVIFNRFRPKRIKLFFRLLGINSCSTVLDVGGSMYFWRLAGELGLPVPKVTITNIHLCNEDLPSNFTRLVADGKALPFSDRSFDAVFCNSVIEHVGDRDEQRRLASEIERVGRSYFVQTPDRFFPIEPHLLMPFIHWLPERSRRRLVPDFTVRGLFFSKLSQHEKDDLRNIWLLNRGELSDLFPNAEITTERFCGLSKSLIAISPHKTGQ